MSNSTPKEDAMADRITVLPAMRQAAYDGINDERDYQHEKWGPESPSRHPIAGWLVVLKGELDEAFKAWQKGKDYDALDEIRQVAAVAVACLEQHGCPWRER